MGAPVGKVVVILGTRSDGTLRTVELTDADAVKVAFAAAAQGLVGTHGYIGSAWQKNPLAFGYSSSVVERVTDTTLSTGQNDLDTGKPSAGEIWVITSISVRYVGTPPTDMKIMAVLDGTSMWLFNVLNPISDQAYDRQGWWVLDVDDYIRLRIENATLNDDAYLYATGFQVDIAL